MLFACPGTVANNFGDYWAVNSAFSYVITYTLVHSGKQTHTVFVSIEVVGRAEGGRLETSQSLVLAKRSLFGQ